MKNAKNVIEEYLDGNNETLFADGFDDAIIGVSVGISARDVVVYDYDKCVEILMQRDSMTHEDAIEYIEYNTVNAYFGKFTPIFMKTYGSIAEIL